LVIASIVDRESFKIQCQELDSATRDYLYTRLDYYQVYSRISKHYRAHSSLTVVDSQTNIIITSKTSTESCDWHGLIWDASMYKYMVTLNKTTNLQIAIGFASCNRFALSTYNFESCGWYLHLYSGSLYSQNGDNYKPYTIPCGCKVGDTITCIYNSSSREISFEKNGVSLGVAFTNVKGEDIAPAVLVAFFFGESITLSIY
jgi:SPRY domain